jgi:hypothetical protein
LQTSNLIKNHPNLELIEEINESIKFTVIQLQSKVLNTSSNNNNINNIKLHEDKQSLIGLTPQTSSSQTIFLKHINNFYYSKNYNRDDENSNEFIPLDIKLRWKSINVISRQRKTSQSNKALIFYHWLYKSDKNSLKNGQYCTELQHSNKLICPFCNFKSCLNKNTTTNNTTTTNSTSTNNTNYIELAESINGGMFSMSNINTDGRSLFSWTSESYKSVSVLVNHIQSCHFHFKYEFLNDQ